MDRRKLMSKIIPALVAGSVLVSTGTLAFAQSSTKAAIQSQKQHTKKYSQSAADNCKTKLDKLVTSSTITQEQENKILDYLKQKETEKKAEMGKVKNMTQEQRKAYFASNPKQKVDLANELVTAGIVSKEQADSVVKALHPANGFKKQEMNTEKVKAKFDKLVSSSVITQEQEDKILDYIKQKDTERKAEMNKVKSMTEAERKAYFASNPKQKTDLLSDLVKSGIITQDQADAIKKAMPAKHGKTHEKTKNGSTHNTTTSNTTT